jgi:hypothetical protein
MLVLRCIILELLMIETGHFRNLFQVMVLPSATYDMLRELVHTHIGRLGPYG